jgi:hypothetical protein
MHGQFFCRGRCLGADFVATAEINRALHPQQEENKINGTFLFPGIYFAVK